MVSGLFCQYLFSLGIEPTTVCAANALSHRNIPTIPSVFKCKGSQAFSVAPPSVKSSPTLGVFQSALKTHLFLLAFENAL